MEENRSIVEGLTNYKSTWHQDNEDAVMRVSCLYSSIAHRFEKDRKYGKQFVENHPEVISQLVQAAVVEVTRLKKGD